MSVIQHITTPERTGGHFITIPRQTVQQQWQLFDDSIVRVPNASDWCSTRVYVMVYQRHENTGPSKQHVTHKDSPQRTDHVVVGAIRRHGIIVPGNEDEISDGTSMRAQPEAPHTVAAGMLLTGVHMAIVQIDGVDEMDMETTIEHGTTPTVSCKLGNSSVAQNQTVQHSSCVSGGDVGVLDIHEILHQDEQPIASNQDHTAVDCGATKSNPGDVIDSDGLGDENVSPSLSNVAINTIIDRQKDGQEELTEILRMLDIHAVPLWKSLQPCVPPDARRDEAYRQVFAPFKDVQELRQELGRAKKGKTGRFTTVEQLQDMTDEQHEPVLIIYNLLLAGESLKILKIGDIIPLLKDIRRTRPITCLDPIFKLVDAVISFRLILVLQEYGLLPEGMYGFVKGGGAEWPADLVSGIQWHARCEQKASCQTFLDATSAYDTIKHAGISSACSVFAVSADVETRIISHIGGHSRVVNTAYGLGDLDDTARLDGGVAQGAPSSPLLYIFTTAAAQAYSNSVVHGYPLPRLVPVDSVTCQQPKRSKHNIPHQTRCLMSVPLPCVAYVKGTGYADDNAVTTGGKAATAEEARAIHPNLQNGTEALTVGLTLVGVRSNLQKIFSTCSPVMQHLLGEDPKLTVAAINSRGQFIRAAITTVPTNGDAIANTPAARGAVRYLGPRFCSGGCPDMITRNDAGYWRENRIAADSSCQ